MAPQGQLGATRDKTLSSSNEKNLQFPVEIPIIM
jgi:hypothetical protein